MRIHPAKRARQRGVALMMVMLVVITLAALVGGLAYTMKVEMRLARNYDNDIEMEWLGRSGIELARYVLSEKEKIPGQAGIETLNQKWAGGSDANSTNDILSGVSLEDVQLGNGSFTVKITDMERKFSINYAGNPQAPFLQIFQNAFNVMQADPGLGSTATDSILDWIDPDDTKHLSGAENDYYEDLGYFCKNDGFDDINELLLVKGIWDHPELYYGGVASNSIPPEVLRKRPFLNPAEATPLACGLRDLFSVYFFDQRININTVDEKVLQLLPGMDPDTAREIIGQRMQRGQSLVPGSPDGGIRNPAELLPATHPLSGVLRQFCGIRSNTFDVEVQTQIGDYKRTFHGILRRAGRDFQLIKFYWD